MAPATDGYVDETKSIYVTCVLQYAYTTPILHHASIRWVDGLGEEEEREGNERGKREWPGGGLRLYLNTIPRCACVSRYPLPGKEQETVQLTLWLHSQSRRGHCEKEGDGHVLVPMRVRTFAELCAE